MFAASSAASVALNAVGARSAPGRSVSGRPTTVVGTPTLERKKTAIFSPISARFVWKSYEPSSATSDGGVLRAGRLATSARCMGAMEGQISPDPIKTMRPCATRSLMRAVWRTSRR